MISLFDVNDLNGGSASAAVYGQLYRLRGIEKAVHARS